MLLNYFINKLVLKMIPITIKMLNIGADNQSIPNLNAVVTPETLQCVHGPSVFQPKIISNITVNCSE